MKDKVIFGPAGKPIDFKGKAFESPEYLGPRGLYAFEYQSTYGVRIGESSAIKLRESAERNGVLMSMHCPYYINVCSKEEEKIDSSIERLIQSAKVGEYWVPTGLFSTQDSIQTERLMSVWIWLRKPIGGSF